MSEQRKELTLSAGFAPNPVQFLSHEEFCRGQADFLCQGWFLVFGSVLRLCLIIIPWPELVIRHGWGCFKPREWRDMQGKWPPKKIF